jgi:hypothetical protein
MDLAIRRIRLASHEMSKAFVYALVFRGQQAHADNLVRRFPALLPVAPAPPGPTPLPPMLSSIFPASWLTAGGTSVTLMGTGFPAGATITFGSAAATSVKVQSSTQIAIITHASAAGAVNVSVTNSNGQSASLGSGFPLCRNNDYFGEWRGDR